MTSAIERFFDTPNELRYDNLDIETRDLVDSATSRLLAGQRTVLPAEGGGQTCWYGIAPDARSGRLLLEEMRAWLGEPFGNGPHVLTNPTDPVDARAVVLAGEGVALRVDTPLQHRRRSRQDAGSLLRAWIARPSREMEESRPVGRVLRELYEAVGAGSETIAFELLNELEDGSLLTARNVLFLKVRLLHGLGRFAELLNEKFVQQLQDLDRPPLVTQLLAEAVDVVHLEPLIANEAGVPIDRLADAVAAAFPGLVRLPRHAVDLGTARCLALNEHRQERASPDAIAKLQELWANDPIVAGVLAANGELSGVGVATAVVASESAAELFRTDRHAELVELLERKRDLTSADFAVAAALDLSDRDYTERVLAAVEELSGQVRKELEAQPSFVRRIASLTETQSEERMPDGWFDWLTGDWPDRPDSLDEASIEWDWVQIDHDSFALELLDALAGAQRVRIRNGLPIIVRTALADSGPSAAIPVIINLVVVLCDSTLDSSERVLLLDLTDRALQGGCTVGEYTEVLGALERVVSRIGSSGGGWLAELIETLFVEACPSPEDRDRLLAAIQARAGGWRSLVERSTWLSIDAALGLGGFALEDWHTASLEEGDSTSSGNASFKVLIYSLLEGASQRTADWILRQYPKCEVRRSNAHVNSPQLESQVAGSDIVIIHTSHAKHSASNAIEDAAGPRGQVVKVHGRGATALFRAFLDYVDHGGSAG